MRQVSIEPRPSQSGPLRARSGAAVFARLLGLVLLTLAIAVPGCQALVYGAVVVAPEAAAAPDP